MEKDIDMDILEQALEYCLENDTPSFANLNDTYAYFKREAKGSNDTFQEIQTLARGYQGAYEPLDVSERSLSLYKELISRKERELS